MKSTHRSQRQRGGPAGVVKIALSSGWESKGRRGIEAFDCP